MNELEKLFDTYSLNARVKPAFLVFFPVVISLFVLYEPSRSWGGASLTLIISFGIISFAANQMSTRGNIIQEKLFKKWGAAPTTIIMRHSDVRLDKYTKNRYTQRLEALVNNFSAVSLEQELANRDDADQMYRTATNYLREHTRDTKKYTLIFNENISYGFSRNIRAFKWVGIAINLLVLACSLFVIVQKNKEIVTQQFSDMLFLLPFEQTSLIAILILGLLVWIFIVTEKWVEVRAFAYARALLASCEQIEK
jgi:hypothetical protein